MIIAQVGKKYIARDDKDEEIFYVGFECKEFDKLTGKTCDNAFNGIEVYSFNGKLIDVQNVSSDYPEIDELCREVCDLTTVGEFLTVAKEYINKP